MERITCKTLFDNLVELTAAMELLQEDTALGAPDRAWGVMFLSASSFFLSANVNVIDDHRHLFNSCYAEEYPVELTEAIYHMDRFTIAQRLWQFITACNIIGADESEGSFIEEGIPSWITDWEHFEEHRVCEHWC
jgi:hypothetical protein